MSKTTKVIGSLLLFILITSLTIGYIINAKFTAERFENSVFAQSESMQNTWGMMEQQLKLSGVTVKNYGETFIKSLEANAKRYENKPQQMMQWVQEAKGVMSPDLHKKLMDSIEKVYAKKESVQLSKISVVQEYRNFRTSTLKGLVSTTVFSYPSDKAKKIEELIISTKQTKETFETGIDKEPDLFK